jgi:hypothetical protein
MTQDANINALHVNPGKQMDDLLENGRQETVAAGPINADEVEPPAPTPDVEDDVPEWAESR